MSRRSGEWFTLQGRDIEAIAKEYRRNPYDNFWEETYRKAILESRTERLKEAELGNVCRRA
jgi:hypothetical protein